MVKWGAMQERLTPTQPEQTMTERLRGDHELLWRVYPKDIPPVFLEIAREGRTDSLRFYHLIDRELIETTLRLLEKQIKETNLPYPVELSNHALDWEITYASGANQAAWSRRGAKKDKTGDWRLASDFSRWERKSTAEVYNSLNKEPRELTKTQKEFERICQENYDVLRAVSHSLTREKFYAHLYAAVEARQRSRIGLIGRMAQIGQQPSTNGTVAVTPNQPAGEIYQAPPPAFRPSTTEVHDYFWHIVARSPEQTPAQQPITRSRRDGRTREQAAATIQRLLQATGTRAA